MKSIKTIILAFLAISIIACAGKETPKDTKPAKTVVDKTTTEQKEAEPNTEAQAEEDNADQGSEELPAEQLEKAKEILAEVNAKSISAVDAEKVFKMHCASCHGFKGNMMVNGAKDLTKSTIDIVNSVAQVYHGKGLMTPYKGLLKSEEIVAVCQYIETLRK